MIQLKIIEWSDRFLTGYVIRKLEAKAQGAELRKKYGFASGIVGVVLNTLLFLLKLAVGILLGSVAVMADAFNNLSDSANSIVTIIGFKISSKPADKEHPFGHGRLEDIIGLIIAISIIFVGLEFGRSSIVNIFSPQEINFSWVSIGVLVFGFFVKFWKMMFNYRIGKRIKSTALLVVAADSRNDCIISAFTVISILVAHYFGIYADGVAGLLVSIVLLFSGYKAAQEAISSILGKPSDKETADNIKKIVLAQNGVLGVHDLVVHAYGAVHRVATIHVEMDGDSTLETAHDIAAVAERAVLDKLGIGLTVHLDPIDTNCLELIPLRDIVKAYFKNHCPKADAHEFRIVHNHNKLQLVFDLQLPQDLSVDEQKNLINGLKQQIGDGVDIIVNLESGFIEE
ncbi:MAG: cation diffusion facilitator family transporter [Defluviitaleaceae bacterium]|nr:cation diffusion facilitator family transporter [Defluviitaleaceae bacterium]